MDFKRHHLLSATAVKRPVNHESNNRVKTAVERADKLFQKVFSAKSSELETRKFHSDFSPAIGRNDTHKVEKDITRRSPYNTKEGDPEYLNERIGNPLKTWRSSAREMRVPMATTTAATGRRYDDYSDKKKTSFESSELETRKFHSDFSPAIGRNDTRKVEKDITRRSPYNTKEGDPEYLNERIGNPLKTWRSSAREMRVPRVNATAATGHVCDTRKTPINSSEKETRKSYSEFSHAIPIYDTYKLEKGITRRLPYKTKEGDPEYLNQRTRIPLNTRISSATEMRVREYRIIIVGACGTGKSSTANTLLGKSVFETGISASSVTLSSQKNNSIDCERSITVVDTVGYNSNVFKKSSLLEAFEKELSGPHAVLLTMSASERFTTEDISSIDQFANLVGNEVYNFIVVVLTHGDVLINNSITIDQFKKDAPRSFRKLVKRCGGRLIEIDNTANELKKKETVNKLLNIVDVIKRERHCFDTYNRFLF